MDREVRTYANQGIRFHPRAASYSKFQQTFDVEIGIYQVPGAQEMGGWAPLQGSNTVYRHTNKEINKFVMSVVIQVLVYYIAEYTSPRVQHTSNVLGVIDLKDFSTKKNRCQQFFTVLLQFLKVDFPFRREIPFMQFFKSSCTRRYYITPAKKRLCSF